MKQINAYLYKDREIVLLEIKRYAVQFVNRPVIFHRLVWKEAEKGGGGGVARSTPFPTHPLSIHPHQVPHVDSMGHKVVAPTHTHLASIWRLITFQYSAHDLGTLWLFAIGTGRHPSPCPPPEPEINRFEDPRIRGQIALVDPWQKRRQIFLKQSANLQLFRFYAVDISIVVI